MRDAAKKELAAHALPSYWMLSRELAISDGEAKKLNRKALPLPPSASPRAAATSRPKAHARGGLLNASLTPAEAMEAAISPIWAEILNLAEGDYDPTDSFFDLGGHSLLASKLVAALTSTLSTLLSGRAVTVLDLFDAPSLRALATSLAPAAPVHSPSRGLGDLGRHDGRRIDLAIIGTAGVCVHACMRACVHACMRACVHACMRAHVRASALPT